MSGGVDSSVAAALLKKQGYLVRGVFMVLHDDTEKLEKNLQDLEKVSVQLGIECEILDLRRRFKKEVVKYFLDEYAAGHTPNPCVFCNENFKFKILLEEAKKNGIDYVATGHYALTRKLKVKEKIIYKLFTAKDKNKDQSYFLYRLGQEALARIIFPLGEYEKAEVRALAKKFKLPVHDKRESQDVCFMAGMSTDEFLNKNLKLKKGNIVDEKGETIGRHDGLPLYTLGQRKGINIGGTGPYYVIAKNFKKNILTVTNNKKESALFSQAIELTNVMWTNKSPKLPLRVLVRSRYRNIPVYATIKTKIPVDKKCYTDSMLIVEFAESEKAAARGQSAVFYGEDGEVIGGGIIK